MPLLNDQITSQVREAFDANLQHDVEVLFFGEADNCDYCDDTRGLLEEVIALSPKLHLSVYDIEKDAALAQKHHVDKTPATVITARNGSEIKDYGIRLFGIPSGHEFSSLVQDLILVSGRESGLDDLTKLFLNSLKSPLHLQVFVTPT
jgi:alkyl hydroperoxide reductase subunit AhpF